MNRNQIQRWSSLLSTPAAGRGAKIVILLMMIAFSVAPLVNIARHQKNKDYDLWQNTGRIVMAGGEVYPHGETVFPFMYPPACAAMLAPLSLLPRWAFVSVLLLLNSASWAASIFLAVFLATGRSRGAHPALYLWPSLGVIPFVHDTYLLGQPALLLLALLLGSFALLRRGNTGRAGVLIAFATAIKAFPVLAAGYLVYRRKWRALIGFGLTLLFLLFIFPMAFRTPAQVRGDFSTWAKGMLFKYDEQSIAQRPDRSYSYKNQSVEATVHRLVRPVPADGEGDKSWKVNLLQLSFRQATWVMVGAVLALVVFYLGATWRAAALAPPADAIEQAMVSLLLLFLAPLSFNYSYVWLLFPTTILLHLGFSSAPGSPLRRLSWTAAAASVCVLALSIPWLRTAQAYGNVFFSGLLLLLTLGIILNNRTRLPPAQGRFE